MNKSREEVEMLLAQLRERLEDVIASDSKFDNDFYLYRWLIQNYANVSKTNKAIRESIEWRKLHNVDELANQEWGAGSPGLKNEISIEIGGITKLGQPITTSNGDKIDARAMVQKYGKQALHRYFIQLFVKLEKCMLDHYKQGPVPLKSTSSAEDIHTIENTKTKVCGKFKTGYDPSWYSAAPIHLVSYKDFSIWNATCVEGIQILAEGAKIGMTHFPSVISEIYFVNLNKFSNMVVKIIKPLINTQSFTLSFYGTDKVKWTKALLEHMDEDQLPLYFGGSGILQDK